MVPAQLKMKKQFVVAWLLACAVFPMLASNPAPPLLNDPVDVSGDFRDFTDFYYLADRVEQFDPATHAGSRLALPPGSTHPCTVTAVARTSSSTVSR